MKTRRDLDHRLDRLAVMLPPWLARARHDAMFWPQFSALAHAILAGSSNTDGVHGLRRLQAMLCENGRGPLSRKALCALRPGRGARLRGPGAG